MWRPLMILGGIRRRMAPQNNVMHKYLSILLIGFALAGSGCEIRKGMYDQPKYEPLQKNDFFADGRSSRLLVEGTVARGELRDDELLYQGRENGEEAKRFPFPITKEVLLRGQERFNIYCAPCHDYAGTGHGMVVQRGFKQPTSLHDPRLRDSNPGYYFTVITGGFGQMPGYAEQVPVKDRWAIAAYIRALQLSQHATLDDVPESERAEFETAAK